jgi:hypothetical protein
VPFADFPPDLPIGDDGFAFDDDLDDELDDVRLGSIPLYGVEIGLMATILGLAAGARGASIDDCCDYILAPHERLPLVGVERELLDRLIAVALERGAQRIHIVDMLEDAWPMLAPYMTRAHAGRRRPLRPRAPWR